MRSPVRDFKISTALFCLMICAEGCGPDVPDITAVRAIIGAGNTTFSEAIISGNYAPLMELYMESAVSMPPHSPPLMGRAAILRHFTGSALRGVRFTSARFATHDLDVSGTMAYNRGSYDLVMEIPDSGSYMDQGKYLAIWKLDADGNWRILTDIWNSNFTVPVPTDTSS